MNRAVFLDRDGTIIVHKPYLVDPDQVELIEGAVESFKKLKQAGFLLIVITNQSVIGRGWATIEQVEATNARVAELYAREGLSFDAHYYCPHAPEENCDCRKPKPGLLLQAAREHDIDLSQSYMIGDNPTDIEAGLGAGLKKNFFLIGPGHLCESKPEDNVLRGDHVETKTSIPAAIQAVLDDNCPA